MQKGNEREKVVLLGFLKDLAGRMGNEAFECRWLARSRNGGIDALRQPLHAEAMRRGLGQAAGALVIAEGAVWIWRLADDRFSQARQRLDYYHAVQHMATSPMPL
jgi:hypothetical protein